MKKMSSTRRGTQTATVLSRARRALSQNQFPLAKSLADQLSSVDRLLSLQILAIANVHIAAAQSSPLDHYSVLQLGAHLHNVVFPRDSDSSDSLFFHYRRLAHLLDPALNDLPSATSALKLVTEAFQVLSDPQKKSEFDARVRKPNPNHNPSFWTLCRGCFRCHLYGREYEGKRLRCVNCMEEFVAEELPEEPPIVEGMDLYYCTWGFFPVGFRNGYRFDSAPGPRPMQGTVSGGNKGKQTARKRVRPVQLSKGFNLQ